MQKFDSIICNIEKVCQNQYLIPTYQRPYVWGKEQLDKLILDFWSAYINEEEKYFIGTVIASKNNGQYELIDGQQRFTTLWLIAFAFYSQKVATQLNQFLKNDNKLRLGFAIRTQVGEYLNLLLEYKTVFTEKFSESRITEDEYLVHIAEAVTTIQNLLNQLNYSSAKTKEGFGEYIFKQVLFVINTSPEKTNLNKLFITLNNSGVQLEQTDILKANLLKHLKSEKWLYSQMWEACEKMNDFFQYNIKSIFNQVDWKTIKPDFLSEFNRKQLFPSSSYFNTNEVTLNSLPLYEIINKSFDDDFVEKKMHRTKFPNHCKSIINFAQLLLHTYRIFLKQKSREDFQLPFHIKNLLAIFNDFTNESEIKEFIELLWKIRYLFDKHVVKWIEDEENEEMLAISAVYIDSNGNFKWDDLEKSNLSILQSVLYHTSNPNTQIWLTPFLFKLLENYPNPLEQLERIDNTLSVSLLEDKATSFFLMDNNFKLNDPLDFVEYLNSYKGTSFQHYWFQKIEYLLWKIWNRNDPKFINYRITRKNSVEHVFPQNHEFCKKLSYDIDIHKNWLNSLGNLGLINVSQNSSYSNQDVKKKKVDFENKLTYDSLKLAKIYNSESLDIWGTSEIAEHQKEMIDLLKQHYNLP